MCIRDRFTLYVNEKLVCPSAAFTVVEVLAVGNEDHVTPAPVDLRNCPLLPDKPRSVTFNLPVNPRSPTTFNLSDAFVVPIPTFDSV